ncbi:MAG: carboxypeptidase-like regulatory domain-containing protein [Bacteroidota bacterium]
MQWRSNGLILLLTLIFLDVFGQNIEGIVRDGVTGETLPYAHVFLTKSKTGEVGYSDGTFSITIKPQSNNDTLLIRFIGYKEQVIPINSIDIDQQLIVEMKPIFYELSTVTVTDKENDLIVGNNKKSFQYTGWGDFESSRGRARGLVIKDIPCQSRVKSIGFRLKHNDWDSVAFRVNFLTMKGGEVDSAIQTRDIIIIEKGEKEWSEFPLDSYFITLCGDIVVVLEWVDAWGPDMYGSKLLTFSISNQSGLVYRRNKGQREGRIIEDDGVPSIYLKLYD